LLDGGPVAVPAVDPDQQLDSTGESLAKDRAYGFSERRTDDRCHDDADVERCLEVRLHGENRGGSGNLGQRWRRQASSKAANIPQEPTARRVETVDWARLIPL
jgi:hypothetical protein